MPISFALLLGLSGGWIHTPVFRALASTKTRSIRISSHRPDYHLGNSEVGTARDGSHMRVRDWRGVPIDKLEENMVELSPRIGEYWKLSWVDRVQSIFVAISPSGIKRYFRADRSVHHLRGTEIEWTPEGRSHANVALARDFEFKDQSPEGIALLALELAKAQIKASTVSTSGEPERILGAFLDSNRLFLERLASRATITIADLESVNQTVGSIGLEHETALTTGVLRGTKKNLEKDGQYYEVDLTANEVGGIHSSGIALFHYWPAAEVPMRMGALLERVNQISRQSSFNEIISIYVDFIKIHPFREGNGRTARVLTDYCLIRAGFPPIPHSFGLSRDVLYMDADEVESKILEAYR